MGLVKINNNNFTANFAHRFPGNYQALPVQPETQGISPAGQNYGLYLPGLNINGQITFPYHSQTGAIINIYYFLAGQLC
jgi:hypothetical protein